MYCKKQKIKRKFILTRRSVGREGVRPSGYGGRCIKKSALAPSLRLLCGILLLVRELLSFARDLLEQSDGMGLNLAALFK